MMLIIYPKAAVSRDLGIAMDHKAYQSDRISLSPSHIHILLVHRPTLRQNMCSTMRALNKHTS